MICGLQHLKSNNFKRGFVPASLASVSSQLQSTCTKALRHLIYIYIYIYMYISIHQHVHMQMCVYTNICISRPCGPQGTFIILLQCFYYFIILLYFIMHCFITLLYAHYVLCYYIIVLFYSLLFISLVYYILFYYFIIYDILFYLGIWLQFHQVLFQKKHIECQTTH